MLRKISAELCPWRYDVLICDGYFFDYRWLLHFCFFYNWFMIRNKNLRVLRINFMSWIGNLNNVFW